jgi:thiamine-phosphate pyrophosphorylase
MHQAARLPAPRLLVVSSRARLCAAAGMPLTSAPELLEEQVRGAAAAGVEGFQLRERDLDARRLLQLAERLALAAGSTMRLVVNDRADVAVAAGLGLHLRAGSIDAARLRPWLPAGTWVTRSVHGASEAAAAGPVDALVAGTVFETVSKPAGHPVLGLEGLARVVRASPVSVFAIGGMTAARWPQVRASGAAGFAGVGWFLPVRGEGPGQAVVRAAGEAAAMADSCPEVSED